MVLERIQLFELHSSECLNDGQAEPPGIEPTSSIAMASFLGLVQRLRQMNNPPIADKKADALKFGILGAANIG